MHGLGPFGISGSFIMPYPPEGVDVSLGLREETDKKEYYKKDRFFNWFIHRIIGWIDKDSSYLPELQINIASNGFEELLYHGL